MTYVIFADETIKKLHFKEVEVCYAPLTGTTSDYHFYREDDDGTCSCKRGRRKAESGIENPQVDAFKEGYDYFCDCYYIIKEYE